MGQVSLFLESCDTTVPLYAEKWDSAHSRLNSGTVSHFASGLLPHFNPQSQEKNFKPVTLTSFYVISDNSPKRLEALSKLIEEFE